MPPMTTRRNRRATAIALCSSTLALAALAAPQSAPGTHPAGDEKPAAPAAPAKPAAALAVTDDDVTRYREHLITLANPFFEGRMPGTRGNQLTASYLEEHFKALGLKPAFTTEPDGKSGEGGGGAPAYHQPFEFGRKTDVTKSVCKYGSTELKPGTDFNVLGVSGNTSVTAPLAFVGYSLTEGPAPDHKSFTSYKETDADDLKGKIAVILRFEPLNADGKSQFTADTWSNSAALYPKLEAAVKHGAAGIIVAHPPGAKDDRVDKLQTAAETGRLGKALDIPVVMMTIPAADALVRAADASGRSLEDLRKIADAGNHGVIDLPKATVTLESALERTPRTTDNVAAVLPGKGALASQYIVIGAHFDHVGDNSLGGSSTGENGVIHPGADDNGSGTAGLLMNAQWLAAYYKTLPETASTRSILFMGFSAEEMGLVGSRWFVKNPSIPAASIDAMLNMDMIGRLRDNKLELAGVGTAKDFQHIIQPELDSSGLVVNPLPGGRGPSDHASFYGVSVPVLHFFTGLHAEYHTPKDTTDLINFEGGTRVAKLCEAIAVDLAARPERLEFTTSTGPSMPDEPAANNPQAAAPATGMPSLKIRFGIAPGSYAEGEPGIPVGEVYPNTSAGDAGIKAGDRLMKWNGQDIKDVTDWMAKMAKHEPGDEVDVTVLRDKAEQVIKVKLKARERGQR
jgi:Zn-dependent M28 family amino/carboxypeptidase